MASGDKCRFGSDEAGNSNYTVVHFDCDDYGDGTITDVRTGKIIRYRPKHWVVEEKVSAS